MKTIPKTGIFKLQKTENDWVFLDRQFQNKVFKDKKFQIFAVHNPDYYSSFRLTFFSPNADGNERHEVGGFDLFGTIISSAITQYQSVIHSTRSILKSDSEFQFQFTGNYTPGLLSFFSSLPAEDFFQNFLISGFHTSPNFSIFNLLKNDKSYWISKDHTKSYIWIRFLKPWSFSPTGYFIRANGDKIPRSWDLDGFSVGEYNQKKYS